MFAKNKKWLFLIILSIIWGSSFILMKKSLLGVTPLQLGALRIIISGIVILLVGFYTLKNIPKDKWKWIILSGLIGTFFPAFLFALAITEIDSAIASILNSLTPLNTILLGFAIFKITSSKQQITGVIIGFIGASILIGAGAQLNPQQNYLYAGLVLIATFLYAINVNLIKKHLQEVSALGIASGNFISVMLPAFVVLFFTDFFNETTLSQSVIKESLIYILILSVFGTAMAKVMFNKLVQMSTPVFASSVTYLILVVALIWGILDGEKFNLIQGLASIVIILGVYMANRKK